MSSPPPTPISPANDPPPPHARFPPSSTATPNFISTTTAVLSPPNRHLSPHSLSSQYNYFSTNSKHAPSLLNSQSALSNSSLQPSLHPHFIPAPSSHRRTLTPTHPRHYNPAPTNPNLSVHKSRRFNGLDTPLDSPSINPHVTLYSHGQTTFDSILHAIDQAQVEILYEAYTFELDTIGSQVFQKLTEAASRGVFVVLVYDVFGSSSLTMEQMEPLIKAGGRVVQFNPILKPWEWNRSPFFRNHRKSAVIDGLVGFTGGMNTSDEYVLNSKEKEKHFDLHGSNSPDSSSPTVVKKSFKDFHTRIIGPSTLAMRDVFRDTLAEANSATLHELPSNAQLFDMALNYPIYHSFLIDAAKSRQIANKDWMPQGWLSEFMNLGYKSMLARGKGFLALINQVDKDVDDLSGLQSIYSKPSLFNPVSALTQRVHDVKKLSYQDITTKAGYEIAIDAPELDDSQIYTLFSQVVELNHQEMAQKKARGHASGLLDHANGSHGSHGTILTNVVHHQQTSAATTSPSSPPTSAHQISNPLNPQIHKKTPQPTPDDPLALKKPPQTKTPVIPTIGALTIDPSMQISIQTDPLQSPQPIQSSYKSDQSVPNKPKNPNQAPPQSARAQLLRDVSTTTPLNATHTTTTTTTSTTRTVIFDEKNPNHILEEVVTASDVPPHSSPAVESTTTIFPTPTVEELIQAQDILSHLQDKISHPHHPASHVQAEIDPVNAQSENDADIKAVLNETADSVAAYPLEESSLGRKAVLVTTTTTTTTTVNPPDSNEHPSSTPGQRELTQHVSESTNQLYPTSPTSEQPALPATPPLSPKPTVFQRSRSILRFSRPGALQFPQYVHAMFTINKPNDKSDKSPQHNSLSKLQQHLQQVRKKKSSQESADSSTTPPSPSSSSSSPSSSTPSSAQNPNIPHFLTFPTRLEHRFNRIERRFQRLQSRLHRISQFLIHPKKSTQRKLLQLRQRYLRAKAIYNDLVELQTYALPSTPPQPPSNTPSSQQPSSSAHNTQLPTSSVPTTRPPSPTALPSPLPPSKPTSQQSTSTLPTYPYYGDNFESIKLFQLGLFLTHPPQWPLVRSPLQRSPIQHLDITTGPSYSNSQASQTTPSTSHQSADKNNGSPDHIAAFEEIQQLSDQLASKSQSKQNPITSREPPAFSQDNASSKFFFMSTKSLRVLNASLRALRSSRGLYAEQMQRVLSTVYHNVKEARNQNSFTYQVLSARQAILESKTQLYGYNNDAILAFHNEYQQQLHKAKQQQQQQSEQHSISLEAEEDANDRLLAQQQSTIQPHTTPSPTVPTVPTAPTTSTIPNPIPTTPTDILTSPVPLLPIQQYLNAHKDRNLHPSDPENAENLIKSLLDSDTMKVISAAQLKHHIDKLYHRMRLPHYETNPQFAAHFTNIPAQVLSSNVWTNTTKIQNYYVRAIKSATRSIYITNPYVVPPRWLKKELFKAAERGVQVHLLLSGRDANDVPHVRLASLDAYQTYVNHGINIYEYSKQKLHAKVMVVDGLHSCVGSFNLDPYSINVNLETTMVFPHNTSVAHALISNTLREIKDPTTKHITKAVVDQWPQYWRFWVNLAYLISRIIYGMVRMRPIQLLVKIKRFFFGKQFRAKLSSKLRPHPIPAHPSPDHPQQTTQPTQLDLLTTPYPIQLFSELQRLQEDKVTPAPREQHADDEEVSPFSKKPRKSASLSPTIDYNNLFTYKNNLKAHAPSSSDDSPSNTHDEAKSTLTPREDKLSRFSSFLTEWISPVTTQPTNVKNGDEDSPEHTTSTILSFCTQKITQLTSALSSKRNPVHTPPMDGQEQNTGKLPRSVPRIHVNLLRPVSLPTTPLSRTSNTFRDVVSTTRLVHKLTNWFSRPLLLPPVNFTSRFSLPTSLPTQSLSLRFLPAPPRQHASLLRRPFDEVELGDTDRDKHLGLLNMNFDGTFNESYTAVHVDRQNAIKRRDGNLSAGADTQAISQPTNNVSDLSKRKVTDSTDLAEKIGSAPTKHQTQQSQALEMTEVPYSARHQSKYRTTSTHYKPTLFKSSIRNSIKHPCVNASQKRPFSTSNVQNRTSPPPKSRFDPNKQSSKRKTEAHHKLVGSTNRH